LCLFAHACRPFSATDASTEPGSRQDGAAKKVTLKGLAQTLDGFCDLAAAQADAEEMRQVAVGIRATAIHALLTAANVAGLSERLNSVAAVLEAAIPPESEPPPDDVNRV
jgi:hypothetical protein